MLYDNVRNSNISYTARCLPVRDANWVCHAISSNFPNFSISKHKPIFEKEARKLFAFEEQSAPLEVDDIYYRLIFCALTKDDFKALPFKDKIKLKLSYLFLSRQRKENLRHLAAIKTTVKDFASKRESCYKLAGGIKKPLGALYFMSKYNMANCYENAVAAKIILRLNGISNAEVVALKDIEGDSVHTVCVFNTDGSNFKNFTKKSIIIDPWIGKADFADNIIRTYRNEYTDYFKFAEKGIPDIELKRLSGIYKKRLKALKNLYPDLIFKSKNRNFMRAD